MNDQYPNPTEYFRFVERDHYEPDCLMPSKRRILQQWWESAKMINPPPGEWRDVPLLPEDDTPPYF